MTRTALILFAAAGLALAQTERTDAYGQPINSAPDTSRIAAPDASPSAAQRAPQSPARPAYGLPPQVTAKAGTMLTVRTNEMLASNRNKVGDIFTATLAQPLVVDGIVVAHRGETVTGRVAEAEKVKGVHRLGLELTNVTLADGTQVPVQSTLISEQGARTPGGAQAATVVTTTGVGALIGAAAARGTGAGIGAGLGAAAGIAAVLATRNHPTVLYPETALTFQITSPITVATTNAPQAFRYVGPEDYQRQPAQVVRMRPAPVYGPGYPPYFWGGYPYYGYGPYYGGLGIGIGFGPRFYGGHGFSRFRR